ncbi:MAG: 4-hydroxy-tetrahydrodipicolinate reductase [Candidatus Cloacimonadota bacterium]|nr:MAG: 4-hydroxy-tetrahydrodipicolinate reductase [Candidatus Cloacimonadota bacterium]
MKITLNGYGQMGRITESVASSYGCEIVAKVDPFVYGCHAEMTKEILSETDVVIDFSLPENLLDNISFCLKNNTPVVIGTTGWTDHLDFIVEKSEEYKTPVIWGSNFSIGMNLFFSLTEKAAELMTKIKDYDPYGIEYHHKKKSDSPSGTALTLCRKILKHYPDKVYQFDRINRVKQENELHFASVRAGFFPGTHKIGFDSNYDTVNIEHIARTREGFAAGAILAAKWIFGKSGVFEFCEVFDRITDELYD